MTHHDAHEHRRPELLGEPGSGGPVTPIAGFIQMRPGEREQLTIG
jgi:hypothetical protein